MRSTCLLLLLPLALAACGNAKEKQAEADARARAAGFVPPSVMSRLDYGGSTERRFQSLDRDADNFISRDELPRQDSQLLSLDRNGDGKISSEEWSKGMLDRFDRMDANRDGSLTSNERQAARAEP